MAVHQRWVHEHGGGGWWTRKKKSLCRIYWYRSCSSDGYIRMLGADGATEADEDRHAERELSEIAAGVHYPVLYAGRNGASHTS